MGRSITVKSSTQFNSRSIPDNSNEFVKRGIKKIQTNENLRLWKKIYCKVLTHSTSQLNINLTECYRIFQYHLFQYQPTYIGFCKYKTRIFQFQSENIILKVTYLPSVEILSLVIKDDHYSVFYILFHLTFRARNYRNLMMKKTQVNKLSNTIFY